MPAPPSSRASRRPASCAGQALDDGRHRSALPPSARGAEAAAQGRRSSPPVPRRASRCASTCRRSTCPAPTPRARALYLYPTKALAQDQARALHRFGLHKQLRPAIYDGDTATGGAARDPRALEPDPHQPRHAAHGDPAPPRRRGRTSSPTSTSSWSTRRTSTAACSARHVANVLRRLRRSRAYGTEPRFLLACATIANPVELAERLTGLDDVQLVDDDGSPGAGARSRCGTRR